MEKEVRDKEGIHKILNALFGRLPVNIIDDGREYPIKVVALKQNGLVIYNSRKVSGEVRCLTLIHNGTKFLADFKFLGGDHKGTEVLAPLRIRMVQASRESARIHIDDADFKPIVTNIINQNEIHKAQGFDDDKVEAVIKKYTEILKKTFEHTTIYFSPRLDNRLRLMQNYEKSIFVPNRKSRESVTPDYFPFDEYIRMIEIVKLDPRFTSEISIPIRYKGYTPLGYIQVVKETALNMDSFNIINQVSAALSRDLIGTGVFQESKEKCEMSDISNSGLSFLHPQSRLFSRSFAVGETVIFDLKLEPNQTIICRAVIKNIKNTEVLFRVGVQFYNLSLSEYKLLDEFLKNNSKDEESND
ncbi:PilZ domain-containing protein [Leptospira sp. GIMC2001]|uniref:PilZ domain-containing protein n=1 Tax=Leptospira sp. GIMC2001 TaxID=1513297 RepID=UPI00234BEF76|nr:PilZ domain-containing protein [Leptospira sp. GIMC2001]WCL48284.1 PilZ domain-containing protein [Leptospira sp. GIMC2001]